MGRYNRNSPQEESYHFPAGNNENASSEMLGSILLIGIFVAAFGIILVMLLSAPTEFVVPAVVIEAAITETDNLALNNTYVLNLRSGDTLQKNETQILVDGIDRTGDFSSSMGGQDWTVWGSGDSLTLDLAGNDAPESVQIIYYSPEGNGILLWDVGTSVTVIPPTGLTPVAAFSANVTSGLSPLTVRFTDVSSNDPYSWKWSFGDGGASSVQNPVHTYTSAGMYTVQLTAYNPDGSGSVKKTGYIEVSGATPPGEPPVVSFIGTPVTGDAPLAVQFNSNVTGTAPFNYSWTFGDGTPPSDATNPLHTYADAGTYDVNLTVTNAYGTDTFERMAYIAVTEAVSAFAQYVVDENVFVYGQELFFAGDSVTGPGATIHITGDTLNTNDLNGGTSLAVSNIYVDGSIELDGGSAALGSQASLGSIYVNGDLYLGNGARNIYGDVYVNGNCYLKDPVIHGTMYIDGDLELGWTPVLTDANIFYTGKFSYPPHMDHSILDKCSKMKSVPGFTIPAVAMPSAKSDAWYSSRGYVSGGALADNIKIFADSYTAINAWPAPSTTENVIIVAKTGDIRLTGMGNRIVTGVLFAPNGEVVFEGSSFEGLVIAKDGFQVTSGGTAVTFKNMNEYIGNPADYPF